MRDDIETGASDRRRWRPPSLAASCIKSYHVQEPFATNHPSIFPALATILKRLQEAYKKFSK